ncbi:Uncharacterised protein r2_g3757 [Pycnogonum litorale]
MLAKVTLEEGDKVLLKQSRGNKLTPTFGSEECIVKSKDGNSIVVETPEGVQYKRNSTHVKKFDAEPPDIGDVDGNAGSCAADKETEDSVTVTPRPARIKKFPSRFNDFIVY